MLRYRLHPPKKGQLPICPIRDSNIRYSTVHAVQKSGIVLQYVLQYSAVQCREVLMYSDYKSYSNIYYLYNHMLRNGGHIFSLRIPPCTLTTSFLSSFCDSFTALYCIDKSTVNIGNTNKANTGGFLISGEKRSTVLYVQR